MNGIEKQAAFYRDYPTDDRSLIPLTIVLATGVALWLLVYLVSAVDHAPMTKPPNLPPPGASSSIVQPQARALEAL
jgi:hypothetical protein